MNGKLRTIVIIALILGILLGGSGFLGESVGAFIGLCSLTIAINWLMIYSATYSASGEKTSKKEKIDAILTTMPLSIPICALFWWALGSIVWPEATALRVVTFCTALPCLLMLPARKMLFSIDGYAFNIKLQGLHPIIVKIIIIGLVLASIFLGVKGCVKQFSEKKYIDALEKVDVEVFDEYFNDSTGKFDFAIRLKNGTKYTITDMCFNMKVYDKTGSLLINTDFYIPKGSVFSQGEEGCFCVYVKQSDVASVEALYYSEFYDLTIQVWITEVEYEEYYSSLEAEYECFMNIANP